MLTSESATSLSQVRKSAHEEVQKVVSRINNRSPSKLTRRQSINQAIEHGGIFGLRSKAPIFDNRCRDGEQSLFSPIPNKGLPPQLIQTKEEIQSMLNDRVKHHRNAERLIEKAEDLLESRMDRRTQKTPSKLLSIINRSIQPLELPSSKRKKKKNHLLQFATSANLNHPLKFQVDIDPSTMNDKKDRLVYRLNSIEKVMKELEEYSVSTPELRAALQIITESTNRRAKKLEKELNNYKKDCMTREEAILLFQSKKNNANFMQRAMDIATNQVRIVIGSEIQSILKNKWNDMTKNMDNNDTLQSTPTPTPTPTRTTTTTSSNSSSSSSSSSNSNNGGTDSNVSQVELQLCFAQNKESPEFFTDLQNILVRIVNTQQQIKNKYNSIDDHDDDDDDDGDDDKQTKKNQPFSVGKTMGIVNKVKSGFKRSVTKNKKNIRKKSNAALEAAVAASKEIEKKNNETIIDLQSNINNIKIQLQTIEEKNILNDNIRNNIKLDIKEHTQNILDLNSNIQQLQENEESKEEEFMSERKKLIKEYKKERDELNAAVINVTNTADDIKKTGIRMEQKVDRVVDEAANKLEQITKNEISFSIKELDIKINNNLEQTKLKLQNDIKTKIDLLTNKINKDEELIHKCSQSLSTVNKLDLTLNDIVVFNKYVKSTINTNEKSINEIQKWISTTGNTSVKNEKKTRNNNNKRLINIEREYNDLKLNYEKFQRDEKSSWILNSVKQQEIKDLIKNLRSECMNSISGSTDMNVKILSMERTLKLNLNSMKHSITQLHAKDKNSVKTLIRQIQHGVRKDQEFCNRPLNQNVNQHVNQNVNQNKYQDVDQEVNQEAKENKEETVSTIETLKYTTSENIKATTTSTTNSLTSVVAPWSETNQIENMKEEVLQLPLPLPTTPLPLPTKPLNIDSNSESIWKAGGIPSISMSNARKNRLRQGDHNSLSMSNEIYKQSNDGSMLWSAPNSIAGNSSRMNVYSIIIIILYLYEKQQKQQQQYECSISK